VPQLQFAVYRIARTPAISGSSAASLGSVGVEETAMGDIAKDEWGRMVRVTGFRGGYLVCERIDKYGRKNGGMAMYCDSELKPAKLSKRPATKATKRKSKAGK
jgi:hypothetical protein